MKHDLPPTVDAEAIRLKQTAGRIFGAAEVTSSRLRELESTQHKVELIQHEVEHHVSEAREEAKKLHAKLNAQAGSRRRVAKRTGN